MVSMNEKSGIFLNVLYNIYNIVSNTSNFDMNIEHNQKCDGAGCKQRFAQMPLKYT